MRPDALSYNIARGDKLRSLRHTSPSDHTSQVGRARVTLAPDAPKMVSTEREIERLLLVVDESSGSKRAIRYVGKFLGHRRGFQIHLLYLIAPLPPELLEFGGAEDPQREKALQAELLRDQEQWITSAMTSAKPTLDEATKALRKAGIADRNIHREFSPPTEPRDAARTVLEQAKATKCHTVVIGHKAHSWFREIAGGDMAQQLLRHANDISIWVVE